MNSMSYWRQFIVVTSAVELIVKCTQLTKSIPVKTSSSVAELLKNGYRCTIITRIVWLNVFVRYAVLDQVSSQSLASV